MRRKTGTPEVGKDWRKARKEKRRGEEKRKGERKHNLISKFLAQHTLKIRILFSHFISFSPVARTKYLPKRWLKPQMQPIWKKWHGKWKGKSELESGARPAFTLNIWWARAAKYNTVLRATVLPSKVLIFWGPVDLKRNHNWTLFLKKGKFLLKKSITITMHGNTN